MNASCSKSNTAAYDSHVPPQITGIAHVELSVTDLDRSVDWYCRLLGAKDVWRGANEKGGYKACAVVEPITHTVLAFTEHASEKRVPFSPLIPGLDHLSFRVADRAAIDAWATWMDEIGVAHDPVDDSGTSVGLNLRDPDGIALEFYVLLPRT
jgi:catechol 2,3-dioxygenase-like lactoylglutathione lyase family enzyme